MSATLPLVSVIIPTRNSEKFIGKCLKSIKNQTYKNLEMVVVDNNSKDKTKEIARKYTDKVFNKGPERSAQRNFGVRKSSGEYVLIIDSDMQLSEKVIESCVAKIQSDSKIKGIVIPEESFGKGFWAECKKLERSFYVGVDWMEAARFFERKTYLELGGYNLNMISGEDWDFSQRVEKTGKIDRIEEFIFHNEGRISLFNTIKKKIYYAGEFRNYTSNNAESSKKNKQTSLYLRYKLFFSNPKKLFSNPILGIGMLFMKTCEFGFGGAGYLIGKKSKSYGEKTVFMNLHSSKIAGPADYFRDFLLRKKYNVFYLSHPLDNYVNRYSVFRFNIGKKQKIKRINLGLFNLIIDFIISLRFILLKNYSVFVGANNFDVIPAIIARKIFRKKIKKIIYFAADFSESRFSSNLLNQIYYLIEKIAIRYSDFVVSNTKRAESKRFEFGLKKEKSIVIPNGVLLEKPIFNKKNIDKSSFIYVGSVSKEHGLYNFLNALKPIIKKFTLVGDGDDWQRVLDFLKKNNIKSQVYHQKSHDFVIDYLQRFNGIGIAPYNTKSKWTYYCSPLKVNEYIASGVPVIISNVPEIADLVKKEKYGIVYNRLDCDEIRESLDSFNVEAFDSKAKEFYNIYNQDNLYSKIEL